MYINSRWDKFRRTVYNAYADFQFSIMEWLIIIIVLFFVFVSIT
jgi:uncharacterized Rmd1/YagE family protein